MAVVRNQPGPTPAADDQRLQTLWVPLAHKHHAQVACLWGILAVQPEVATNDHLNVWHQLYCKVQT